MHSLEAIPPYDFYLTMEKNFAIRRGAFGDLFDGEHYIFAVRDPPCVVKVYFTGNRERPSFDVEISQRGLSNRDEGRVLKKTTMLLGCNEDLETFYELAAETELSGITEHLRGVHMLQFGNLFTALVLGILLQNAPVKRSIEMFSFLLERYGARVGDLYPPLKAQDLKGATPEELRGGKLGYRSSYVLRLVEDFDEGLEARIERMRTPRAKEELVRFRGVGDYTAEFALFGSNYRGRRRYDVFPIDSWSLGIYADLFSISMEGVSREKAKALCRKHAEEHFGDATGLALWYTMMSVF